jgi:hypothetical protein
MIINVLNDKKYIPLKLYLSQYERYTDFDVKIYQGIKC